VPLPANSCDRHSIPKIASQNFPVTTNGAEKIMSLGSILLLLIVLMIIGVIPTWPHSRDWGYRPSGILGVVLLVLLILFLMGKI
jgi:hypothetical protein